MALGSDGAAVMLGKKGGVAALLKQEGRQPKLQAVHCMAHRLELAFKASIKGSVLSQVDELLLHLYLFYHGSPKNRSILRNACKALSVTYRVPPRVGGTRWVPHLKGALEVLWTVYPAMLQQFLEMQEDSSCSKDAKSKALGFYTKLVTRDLLWSAHLLSDIVNTLSRLSTTFQASNCTVSEVKAALGTAQNTLNGYKARAGPKLRKVQEIQEMEIFKTHKLKDGSSRRPIDKDSVTQETLGGLVGQLQGRFSDVDEGILEACQIASFHTWPISDEDQDFGMAEVQLLVDTLDPVLNIHIKPEMIEVEWVELKTLVFKTFPHDLASASWVDINKRWGQRCPNILALVDYILTLPASSAICERGFSKMKQIKSDFRSRMSSSTLTMLMRIILATPCIEEFDPVPAISLWDNGTVSGRARRPDTLPYGQRDSQYKPITDSESDSDISDIDLSQVV